jgi:hypothetical protein
VEEARVPVRREDAMTWGEAVVRAAILIVASAVVFLVVPDRLIAYLSLHVAPRIRDLLVTLWSVAAFAFAAYLFVRLQRGRVS